jgi:hypothetical protein
LRNDRRAILALGLAFIALWIVYGVPLQNLAYDPSFYYAHIRSPVIDGDLDFANESIPQELVATKTRTGLVPSLWSAGPGLAWSPFFLAAHLLTLSANSVGIPLPADGYSPLYLTLVALGSAFIGWLGVVCCYALARTVAEPMPSLIAALSAWIATPLFFFMFRIPLYAHAPTVALIAAAMLVWLHVLKNPYNLWRWFLLGLLIGLAALMRWQNALFAVLVPFALPLQDRKASHFWPDNLRRIALAAIGALIGFSPQVAVWQRLYGQPFALPQGGDFFHWLSPAIFPILLGSNRGVFVWMPIALIGLLGLAAYTRGNPRAGGALFLVAALETYLNSVAGDWWGGGGFGPRRFDWLIPMLALGLATLLQRHWRQRVLRSALMVVCAASVFLHLALAQAYYYRILPNGQPFPIAEYDHGLPLPAGFFSEVVVGTIMHPGFLVQVSSSIWSKATPMLESVLRAARGAIFDAQFAASLLAALMAVVLIAGTIWLLDRILNRWNRRPPPII